VPWGVRDRWPCRGHRGGALRFRSRRRAGSRRQGPRAGPDPRHDHDSVRRRSGGPPPGRPRMKPLWTPDELGYATGGALRAQFGATGVSIDTRTLQPGDLFVALVGERGDGHAYIADALAKGAAGALVHRIPNDLPADAPLLAVPDTLAALQA